LEQATDKFMASINRRSSRAMEPILKASCKEWKLGTERSKKNMFLDFFPVIMSSKIETMVIFQRYATYSEKLIQVDQADYINFLKYLDFRACSRNGIF
jgi:hypothetical protein